MSPKESSASNYLKMQNSRVKDIFSNMSYDPVMATHHPGIAKSLSECIDGLPLSLVDGDSDGRFPFEAAAYAMKKWQDTPVLEQFCVLNRISDLIKKHSDVLSALDSSSTDNVLQYSSNYVIPHCSRHFEYFASVPIAMKNKLPAFSRQQVVICFEAHTSFRDITELLAPALAAGCSVLLIFDMNVMKIHANLPAVFLVKHLHETGLLSGLVQIEYALGAGSITVMDSIHIIHRTKNNYAVLVFDDSDVGSAVDEIGRVMYRKGNVCRILVKENVVANVARLLAARFLKLRAGDCFDKTVDVSDSYADSIRQDAECLLELSEKNSPLLCHLSSGDFLAFRTAKEAVTLANDWGRHLRASVWTESTALSLEVAKSLHASTVWVNCIDMYDASVPFENDVHGAGLVNGTECVYRRFLSLGSSFKPQQKSLVAPDELERGCFRQAISSAQKTKARWRGLSPSEKSKIFVALVEAIVSQREQFCEKVAVATGKLKDEAAVEVDCAVERLGFWASGCATNGGRVQECDFDGKVLITKEPLGLVVILCQSKDPLLALVSVAVCAIAHGNVVVVLSREGSTKLLESFNQVLSKAGLPNGVLSVVESLKGIVDRHHIENQVDVAISMEDEWQIYSPDVSLRMELLHYRKVNWFDNYDVISDKLTADVTRPKPVWLPSGVTFAN